MPDTLLIEYADFLGRPVGGQVSFGRQLIKVYGDRLALVGAATDGMPVGVWTEKEVDGTRHAFFPYCTLRGGADKPLIPLRLQSFLSIRRYRKQILSRGITSVLLQAPELLLATQNWGWDKLCYRYAGVTNSLAISRYGWAKWFSKAYERRMFSALRKVDVLLASADCAAIDALVARSNGMLERSRVVDFPTRVDTSIFRPLDREEVLASLNMRATGPIVVNVGRVGKIKGYELVLDAFQLFRNQFPGAQLLFVGDGEDREDLRDRAEKFGLAGHVRVTGFASKEAVALYLNAADIVVVGSFTEGWSIAMLEAIACGKAVVSTDVSGAREMIRDGVNGFIVPNRRADTFAEAMAAALELPDAGRVSLEIASRYSLQTLKADLDRLFFEL